MSRCASFASCEKRHKSTYRYPWLANVFIMGQGARESPAPAAIHGWALKSSDRRVWLGRAAAAATRLKIV
jgi:hypothetical protein